MDIIEATCLNYCRNPDNLNLICQMPNMILFTGAIVFFSLLIMLSRRFNEKTMKYHIDLELIGGMGVFSFAIMLFLFQVLGLW